MPRYSFSGHETFPLRYSWLPKGLRELARDPDLFFKDDAIVTLGVGKNMVRAIRHWCTALGLAKVDGRSRDVKIKPLGKKLFLDEEWDPYLEDPGTLWLLQWLLASRPDQASTWYLAFTQWSAVRFTKEEMIDWLYGIVQDLEKSRASRNSIKRDVDVFLRTYVPSDPSPYRPIEDSFDSPLVELGLIREEEKGVCRFVRGHKRSLPREVFAFALLEFWNESAKDRETLSFERILYDPGSPGGAFKLSESALATLLEKLPNWTGLQYDETAGMRVVMKTSEIADSHRVLEEYYKLPTSEGAV